MAEASGRLHVMSAGCCIGLGWQNGQKFVQEESLRRSLHPHGAGSRPAWVRTDAKRCACALARTWKAPEIRGSAATSAQYRSAVSTAASANEPLRKTLHRTLGCIDCGASPTPHHNTLRNRPQVPREGGLADSSQSAQFGCLHRPMSLQELQHHLTAHSGPPQHWNE